MNVDWLVVAINPSIQIFENTTLFIFTLEQKGILEVSVAIAREWGEDKETKLLPILFLFKQEALAFVSLICWVSGSIH